MQVTFKGTPMTLIDQPLKPGEQMPSFTLCGPELEKVESKTLTGPKVFLSVPSLDTGVCDAQVRRFNQAAAAFRGVTVYAVSMDLPFAQARWCGAAGVERMRVLSDFREREFGKATGTLIKELGLLTRAVFVVDGQGKLTHVEYVGEVAQHPDYDAALAAIHALQG